MTIQRGSWRSGRRYTHSLPDDKCCAVSCQRRVCCTDSEGSVMGISERDMAHVFERLRSGVVPECGLEMFAVGIEPKRAEIHRLLKMAEDGEGVFKFLRGGYDCGKTFMARLALIEAQARGFATSFVVVSD